MTRKAFIVCVDLDDHTDVEITQKSAEIEILAALRVIYPNYNPTVSLAPKRLQPNYLPEES